jgi:hypothetical protein
MVSEGETVSVEGTARTLEATGQSNSQTRSSARWPGKAVMGDAIRTWKLGRSASRRSLFLTVMYAVYPFISTAD